MGLEDSKKLCKRAFWGHGVSLALKQLNAQVYSCDEISESRIQTCGLRSVGKCSPQRREK